MGDRVRTAVIMVVCLVWAANFIAPLFVKDYQPSPELNVAFMAVIGFVTASYGSNAGNRRPGNQNPPQQVEDGTTRPQQTPEQRGTGGVDE